ncbi:acyl-CoA thioesterase domain-containing protein [Nocardia spumae]|uniref:acyl-CoA thioesterase domain-containing protein n=1 Tax=Nocardia spumae TaxID=2887190 RepID=UPI0035584419
MLGQFVRAAQPARSDKSVESVHALFPREGKPDREIRYRTQVHHQGRTFATAPVLAEQPSGVIATASISLHAADTEPEQQARAAIGPLPPAEHKAGFDIIPWETRTTADLDDTASAPTEFELWMRTPTAAAALAPALTAYATDLTLIGTAPRPLDGGVPARQRHRLPLRGHQSHAPSHRKPPSGPP